jgi:molybdopterin molybdotransferase
MPAGGEIRNSNSYELAAAVMRYNGEAFVMDPALDSEEVLQQRIAEAVKRDLVVMSGGVSMGTRDLVLPVLREHFGAEFFFAGVGMRPGKPVVFGMTREGRYFFGLPGNPVSSLVTFLLFVRPMLAAMAGESGVDRRWVQAEIAEEIVSAAGLTRFLPAKVRWSEGRAIAELVAWRGSGDLAALSQADGCVMVAEDCARVERGATVQVLLMS